MKFTLTFLLSFLLMQGTLIAEKGDISQPMNQEDWSSETTKRFGALKEKIQTLKEVTVRQMWEKNTFKIKAGNPTPQSAPEALEKSLLSKMRHGDVCPEIGYQGLTVAKGDADKPQICFYAPRPHFQEDYLTAKWKEKAKAAEEVLGGGNLQATLQNKGSTTFFSHIFGQDASENHALYKVTSSKGTVPLRFVSIILLPLVDESLATEEKAFLESLTKDLQQQKTLTSSSSSTKKETEEKTKP